MKRKDLDKLILEAYAEVLSESLKSQFSVLDEADEEDSFADNGGTGGESEDTGGVGTYDPSSKTAQDSNPQEALGMKRLLSRFPTLQVALTRLQTDEFKSFVDSIDWVSPRPSAFRVNLKNGQEYTLTWTGEGFKARIMGKEYFINNISDYQQALDKLSILYTEAPFKNQDEEVEEAEVAEPIDTSTGGGGGGEFPGEESGGVSPEAGGEETPEPAELEGEPIDFEAGAEPEA